MLSQNDIRVYQQTWNLIDVKRKGAIRVKYQETGWFWNDFLKNLLLETIYSFSIKIFDTEINQTDRSQTLIETSEVSVDC